jgi:hypothetical protein
MSKKQKRPGTCDVCGRIQCVARKRGIICADFYEIPDKARCNACKEPIKPGEDYGIIKGRILCKNCMGAQPQAHARPQAQAPEQAGVPVPVTPGAPSLYGGTSGPAMVPVTTNVVKAPAPPQAPEKKPVKRAKA